MNVKSHSLPTDVAVPMCLSLRGVISAGISHGKLNQPKPKNLENSAIFHFLGGSYLRVEGKYHSHSPPAIILTSEGHKNREAYHCC